MIDYQQLNLGKNASGDEVWICGHCGQPANEAKGLANKPDDLVYLLMCPFGKVRLGEWVTLEEKNADLKAHKERLKASNK
jgi:hypothetical protein